MKNDLGNNRWAGLAGLAGALLFFVGDMILVGHWGAGSDVCEGSLRMLRESTQVRLFIGDLAGPIAGCLCLLGFWHVRQNLIGRSPYLGRVVLFALGAAIVAVSVVHELLVPLRLAHRYSDAHPGAAVELFDALRSYLNLAHYLEDGPAYLGAFLLLSLVLSGWSSYPRWTAMANFGLLSFIGPLAHRVPVPFGSVLFGGFESLTLSTFFLVSVIATWRGPATQKTGCSERPDCAEVLNHTLSDRRF